MKISLQTLYDHSPIPIQNIMTSAFGYSKNRTRYGLAYWEHRRFLVDFDGWSLAAKLAYQRQVLTKFLEFSKTHSALYRDLYAEVDLSKVLDVSDLASLPRLTKETLRRRLPDAYTIGAMEAVEAHTGGTTGKSLTVRLTPEDMMKRMAMLDHFKARVGFENRKMRRATFSGTHIVPPGQTKDVYWRYNSACRQMLYSTFNLSDQTLGSYVRSLNAFKPDALDGFPSAIIDIASYIERTGVSLEFTPVAVFPTAETITPIGREQIERVFGCKVFDQYASSEGAPFITECIAGTLHVEHASGIFEPASSEDDEVLVTSFTTHGTPLIRYAIGDSMELAAPQKCRCGIESGVVASIDGRKDDYILRADGGKVQAVNVANMFKYLPSIVVRAQVVQKSIDEVQILLQADKDVYSEEHESLLRAEFEHKFGTKSRLTIIRVDEVPREANGKYRLIKNPLATLD